MLWAVILACLKQESVSLLIRKIIATAVTPELGLVQEGILMTPTRVETRQDTHQIMETKISQPLDTSWCSEKNGLLAFKATHLLISYCRIVRQFCDKKSAVKQRKHGDGIK